MVVKSERGRRRYIAFRTDESLTREALISKLRSLLHDDAPYVVQCSGGWCILRTDPAGCEVTIDLMGETYPGTVSLSTSGTLRTLRDRYPPLKQARIPARK